MLKACDDVRVRLGCWGGSGDVLVDRLSTRTRHRLSSDIAAVLVLFFGGRTREDGTSAAARTLGISSDKARSAVEMLEAAGLIEETEIAQVQQETSEAVWRSNGWTAAYDYHMATWNYPFVDYDVDGWERDRSLMKEYRGREADTSVWRHERCFEIPSTLPIVRADDALDSLPAEGSRSLGAPLSAELLMTTLSVTFGRLPPHQGKPKPHRTSPSGGARHPIEGYVFNMNVSGLERCVWHVRGRESDLVRIADLPEDDWLLANMSGMFLAGHHPDAIVVVTAVFGRNMYRYREPRTFRTIFLDAGHIVSTLEMACAALGIDSHVHHAVNDAQVEKLLGLDGLTEGVLMGVGLAGGKA